MIEFWPRSRLYCDTNIFIYLLEGNLLLAETVGRILDVFEAAELTVVTSELAVAECLYKPAREGDAGLISDYERLFVSGEFEILALTAGRLRSAALEGGRLGLKLLDAIHFATAIDAGCRYFLTADRRFCSAREVEVIHFDDLAEALGPP